MTSGGGQPDILSLLIVLSGESNPTVLAQGTLVGDTSLRLALNGSQTNEQYNLSDMIYIGKTGRIGRRLGRFPVRTLIIDTDPVQPGNQGLKNAYPPGTEVGEISLVSYAVFNDKNDPGGKSHDSGSLLKEKDQCLWLRTSGREYYRIESESDKKSILSASAFYSGRPFSNGQANGLTMTTQVMKRNRF